MIVLDTNVVSEMMRPEPSVQVVSWVRSQPGTDLYTTSVTLAEIRYGIARLPDGNRKTSIQTAANSVFVDFSKKVLAFDAQAANRYGDVVAHRAALGTPIDGFDAQIASICQSHGARLATRNVSDFTNTGIDVINPWSFGV